MLPPHPVKLFGFDWPTQNKLIFDPAWAAAFLTHRFTNEDHELLATSTYICDVDKKREVKYGNSISALFRALVHLGQEGGQPQEGFWTAIARGFNTNTAVLRETVDILTEARKLRQNARARETSETARAADQWIDFIGHCFQTNPIKYINQFDQISIVKKFLSTLEGKLINEARIPLNPAPRWMLAGGGNKWTPPSSTGSNRELVRKRSASPMPTGRSSDIKKLREDKPTSEAKKDQGGDNMKREPVYKPAEKQPELKRGFNGTGSKDLDPPRQLLEDITAMVEEEVSAMSAKPVAEAVATPEIARVNNQVGTLNTTGKASDDDMDKVKQEMAGMKGIMEIMMESMHTVADSLTGIKDDIANIKTKAGPEKPDHEMKQTLGQLKDEIINLRSQMRDGPTNNRELRALLEKQVPLMEDQTKRLHQLAMDMNLIQAQLPKTAPTTLRQAVVAAETDLRYHSETMSKFYRNQNGHLTREASERVGNFLLLLDEGVRLADKLK